MAHKKAAGSTQNGRESQSQRLGVKLSDGQRANAGSVIVRQRGTKVHPGENVLRGSDDTLYAAVLGIVAFKKKMAKRFTGALVRRTYVSVRPMA